VESACEALFRVLAEHTDEYRPLYARAVEIYQGTGSPNP
jgi:hypothetical protein